MADIPGINEPAQHAAPILTTIGYINWWEGRGSKAHQYMQLALDTDPGYLFARLTTTFSEPASSPDGTPTKTPPRSWLPPSRSSSARTEPTSPEQFCHRTVRGQFSRR